MPVPFLGRAIRRRHSAVDEEQGGRVVARHLDIQLFTELFDTSAAIERVTSEADLIEKQLNRSGMYPLPQMPLPYTSGFIPRPGSTFQIYEYMN